MRHADSKITLEHYAHIVGDDERVASEKFSIPNSRRMMTLQLPPSLNWSQLEPETAVPKVKLLRSPYT